MKQSNIFKTYIWLLNTIMREGKVTLTEISQRWKNAEMSDGAAMSRATFNRYRNAIEDIFGIAIGCTKDNTYQYYVANPEVLKGDSIQKWMLSTLSINNVVSDSLDLHDRILMETAPIEGELLRGVIDAMRKGLKMEISHRRYGANKERLFVIDPYCIKLFKHRWYVLGKLYLKATETRAEGSYFALFSFDRIMAWNITEEHFEVESKFDAEAFFYNGYGVMLDNSNPPQTIVLRAYDNQRFYLRDLPLHHSQQICGEGENWMDFKLFLHPTSDFVAQILSYGQYVKVMRPESLAKEVRRMHQDAAKLY